MEGDQKLVATAANSFSGMSGVLHTGSVKALTLSNLSLGKIHFPLLSR